MCNHYKNCIYAIDDRVEDNIEVFLFCSFHECLPEDCPKDCQPNQTNPKDLTFETYLCPHMQAWLRDGDTEVCMLDDSPCVSNCDKIGHIVPIIDPDIDWTNATSDDDLPF